MPSLRDLEREIERIKRKIRELSEGDVEISIVIPILGQLGWNIANPKETRSKYNFTVRSSKEVDIALFSGDEAVVFFEVKKTSSALSDKDKMQLLEYCRLQGVQLGILTNGFVWKFYGKANRADTKDAAEVIDIRSASTTQAAKVIRHLLERRTVIKGEVHRRLEKTAVKKDKRERSKDFLQGIWRRIPQDEGLQKQLAGFLRRVANKESQQNIPLDVAEEVIRENFKSPATRAKQYQPTGFAKRKADLSRPHAGNQASMTLIIFGERVPVETWRDALVQALLTLHRRDSGNLGILAEKMPRIITKSRAKPSSMRVPKQIGESNFWVNCHWGVRGFESIFKRICKNLGLDEDAIRVQVGDEQQR